MSTAIKTQPDLSRTRAALAAYDAIDSELADDMTEAAATDFFARLDAAKLAIGDAFALDTADRNDPEVARSWAAFNVESTRAFVMHLITHRPSPLALIEKINAARPWMK